MAAYLSVLRSLVRSAGAGLLSDSQFVGGLQGISGPSHCARKLEGAVVLQREITSVLLL